MAESGGGLDLDQVGGLDLDQVGGLDLDQVDEQVIVDNQRFILAAIEDAGEINIRFADARVDWRELAGFDPAGRKADSRPRAMENIARVVRSGVAVAVSEARIALGLPPQPPEGETLLRSDGTVESQTDATKGEETAA